MGKIIGGLGLGIFSLGACCMDSDQLTLPVIIVAIGLTLMVAGAVLNEAFE